MITLNKINKSFGSGDSKTLVLKDLELSVPAGEFVAVMGKSGCGKTTLLNILGTLEVPDSGEYLLNGTDTVTLKERDRCRLRRQKLAVIYQNYNLVEDLNVYDNIILPFLLDRKKYDIEYFKTLTEEMEIDKLIYKRAGLLSGGEKQRVAITRALLQKPDVVLADEPTGNLDSVSSEIVIHSLERGNREHGQTIVMVTHDLEIAEHADRIIHMKDGKFIKEEKSGEADNKQL